MKNHIAPADCPPETGGRAKRRGWMRTDRNGDKANADQVSTPSPCGVVRTSYWRVRPSKGTEADLLLLLKTFFSPCRGRVAARWDVAKDSLHYNSQQPLSPPETGGVPVRGRGYDVSGKLKIENCHTPSVASLLCPASHWGVLPSEGTEAHSVLLLKTLFAPYLRGTKCHNDIANPSP